MQRFAGTTAPTTIDDNYAGLAFTKEELEAAMRDCYGDLIEFACTAPFQLFHEQMMALEPRERPAFVAKVLFDEDERASRNIVARDGILIQTSAFGDRRPTLFAVKKLLPKKFWSAWENVNLTFDNEYDDETVPRSAEAAWRPPLPVALQNELISKGQDLQSLSIDCGVDFGIYKRE